MFQSWHDLLFAHWPVPLTALRDLVPGCLEIDLLDGQAWVGVVPFRMTDVRLRRTPAMPWLSSFAELNVRTYVRVGDKRGVYFFSLDAANPLAVEVARRWFHLPYFNARMRCAGENGTISYQSTRTDKRGGSAELDVWYRPLEEPRARDVGSVEAWLTERYCLYTADKSGQLFCGDIHHRQWPLQQAEAEFSTNTMPAAAGIVLPEVDPLLHFSKRLDVLIWPLKRCACDLI